MKPTTSLVHSRFPVSVFTLFALATSPAGVAAQVPDITGQSPAPGQAASQAIPGTGWSFDLAFVPAGSFQIGSPATEPGRDEDEGPQRSVTVDPFWMATTEVTHDLFSIFRQRGLDNDVGATPDAVFSADAVSRPSPPYEDPSHGMSQPGYPATGMTRLSALRFARWLSTKTGRLYRLPTEAEWEWACRAGPESGPLGTGVDASGLDQIAWHAGNSESVLREAGTKEPNPWGIHDLLGNAAEWTMDPYQADFYGSLAEGGVSENPRVTPSVRGRGVVRGGAFDDEVDELRCANRTEETPAWKRRDPQIPKSRWWNTDSPHVGFRLVSPAREFTAEEIQTYWDELLGSR